MPSDPPGTEFAGDAGGGCAVDFEPWSDRGKIFFDGFMELLGPDGFGDVIIHTRRQAPLPVSRHGVGSHGHDGDTVVADARGRVANHSGRFIPIHLAHSIAPTRLPS